MWTPLAILNDDRRFNQALLNHCPGFQLSSKYPMQCSCFCWWCEILLNFNGCLGTSASISSSIKNVWVCLSGSLSRDVNEDIVFLFVKRSGLFYGLLQQWEFVKNLRNSWESSCQLEAWTCLKMFWQNIIRLMHIASCSAAAPYERETRFPVLAGGQ